MFLSFFVILQIGHSQTDNSHTIYNQKMKKSSYKKLLKEAMAADIVFFGEMHDDPISHWLELKLLKDISAEHGMVLGFEMFERDNQEALDKYVNGSISADSLKTEARLWKNFKTDYKPMVDFAIEHNMKCVATNVPRVYASNVYKEGFEALEQLGSNERAYLAPLPIEYDANLASYQEMLSMMAGHGGENLPKAQAIKDATMAYSIAETYEKDKKYIHYNGSFHSDDYEGIIWYLNKYKPGLKIFTITTRIDDEENMIIDELKGKANYIIAVHKDMTKSY